MPELPPPPPPRPPERERRNESASSSGSLRVSLMPLESDAARPPDLRRRLIILVLVVVLETAVLGGLYAFLAKVSSQRESAVAATTDLIASLRKEIDDQEKQAEQTVLFNAQLGVAGKELDNHVRWTNIFNFLEVNARQGVRFTNFSGDVSGTVAVDAVARTYRDLAEQIVALRDRPEVLDVRTTTASAKVDELGQVNGVQFSMVIKLDPKLFLIRSSTVTTSGTSNGITTTVSVTTESTAEDAAAAAAVNLKFKACQPGVLSEPDLGFVKQRYTIVGKVDGGCQVTSEYTVNPNPEYLGKQMTCVYDNTLSFTEASIASFEKNLEGCQGPLVALLRPSEPAPLVQPASSSAPATNP